MTVLMVKKNKLKEKVKYDRRAKEVSGTKKDYYEKKRTFSNKTI
jgi:hypothetical protein